MFEQGDVLTLDDKKQYTIVDQFSENGKNYIYLIGTNDFNDIVFARLENDEIVDINPGEELDFVIKKFNERLHQN